MTDLTWPEDIVPFAVAFYLQPHTGGTQSPFSLATKTYGLSAPRWICRMQLRAPDSADRWSGDYATWGERVDAFLAELEGRAGRVWIYDFRRDGAGNAFRNAAITAGDTAVTLTGAALGDIRIGEYIGGDGRPHIITGANASGSDLVLTVKPAFEDDVAAGAAKFVKVAGRFMLMSDDAAANGSEVGQLTQYDLEFVEEPYSAVEIILPAVFNNQLAVRPAWGSTTVSFDVNPYDAIDVTRSGTVTHYYVDWDTGADTNDGLTSGTAFKTFEKVADAVAALADGSKAIIHLLDDYVGYLSTFSLTYAEFDGRHTKIKGEGPSGYTRIVDMRKDHDQASFAWVAHGTGAWKSNSASAGGFPLQFYLDGNKIPTPIVSTGQSAASVGTTELTSHWDGTYLYVHLPAGAKPDPEVNWEYSGNHGALTFKADTGTLLFENCGFFRSGGGAAFDGFFCRSVTDADFTSQARFGMRNCFGYGASGNVFALKDFQIIVLDNCEAAYAKLDLFNYHTNQSTGTHGEFMTIYEVGCSGHDAGYTGFNDGVATSTSANGSTSHDSMHVLRANGTYSHTTGAVIADVNGVVSVNLNCNPSEPYGAANPKALYWHSGTGWGANSGMYLAYCKGSDGGDPSIILMTNSGTPNAEADGQIYIKNWRGQIDGTVVGTLKDWDGNVLASLADAV